MPVIIENIEIIDDEHAWLGYVFTMNNSSKNIIFKISNAQNCCERFGIHSPCRLVNFIGAEYKSVEITTTEKYNKDLMTIVEMCIYTNRGKIILQLYNEHNGYYLHDFFTQTEHGTTIESL